MSDPLYDVLADLVVPGLSGIGVIVFGLGAVVAAYRANDVADQSQTLAETVRKDELKREADAARERYRDQMFRTVEPTVSALLAHRAEILNARRLGTALERNLLSDAIARLRLVLAVVSPEDKPLVSAAVEAYRQATDLHDMQVLRIVTGNLALMLPALMQDNRDIPALVVETEDYVQRAIDETTPTF